MRGPRGWRRLTRSLGTIFLTILASVGGGLVQNHSAVALPPGPFLQCPSIGWDVHCQILFVINADASITVLQDLGEGPYDGVEDTLIGVQNNSSGPVTGLALSGPSIFGFDGDGLCAVTPKPEGCPFGETGYEGPNTSFTVANANEGTVNFTEGGIPAGGSAYFSLEESIEGFKCTETGCEGQVTGECTKAFGRAFYLKLGEPGRLNLLDKVSTNLAEPQRLIVSYETGAIRYRLTKLQEATCEGAAGARDFHGIGAAAKGTEKGYTVDFHIQEVAGGYRYEATVTKEGGLVVFNEAAPLGKTSKTQAKPQTIE